MYFVLLKFVLASDYSLSLLVELNITGTKPSCLFVRLVTKKNMHKTKQKLAYRLVFCLVLLMFFFVTHLTNKHSGLVPVIIDLRMP